MKKLIGYIVLLMVMMIPVYVDAATVGVSLNCPAAAVVGETVDCQVNVSSDVLVNGLGVKYSFNGVTYVSFTPQSGFVSNYDSNVGFSVGNNAGKNGSFTAGILKVKVNAAASVTLTSIDVSDTSFASYTVNNQTSSIRLKSSNSSLSALSITGGTISPAFSANVTNYTATVDAASITINASKSENSQSISGTGAKTLKYGANSFSVVVTSEAGTTTTYTIVVTRPDNRSSNNYLSSLSVDVGKIAFKKGTNSYSLNVGKDVASMNISATLEDSKAVFVNKYGARTVNLAYGTNSYQVKVQAENGAVRTYTIKVTREDGRSSNNNLKSIKLSNGNISFNKDTLEYSTSVPFEVTSVEVIAEAEDSTAKVSVNSPVLAVGENTITITVTSESGQNKIYTIKVKRLEEAAILSSNNNVSSIDVLGHGIEFDPNTNEYEISIGDEYALVIDVLLEDPTAKYIIEGNKDLKDGSVIKIISTSENGEVKEYKLRVKKELKENESGSGSSLLMILIGFVLGLVTMFVTLTIINKMKAKKGDSKSEQKSVLSPTPSLEKEEVVEPAVESEAVVESSAIVSETVPTVPTEVLQESVVVETPAPVVVPQPAPSVTSEVQVTTAPVMQEANVSQPVSQTANVIPENNNQ